MAITVKNANNCVIVDTVTDGVLTGNITLNINVVKSIMENSTDKKNLKNGDSVH